MTKRLEGSIALVTGASRGIGAAIAKAYAKEGAHVILTARTISGLEEVNDTIVREGGQATIVPLDLRDFNKIDELGGIIAERFGRLDILVGNAGMLGILSPIPHIAPDVWEKTFAVNVTANYRLIRSFDPLLRLSKAGRAVFVTSGVTHGASPFWGVYASSKAALNQMVLAYAAEVEKTNIRVNVIDPGVVRTRMRAEAMPGEDPMRLPLPEVLADTFIQAVLPECTSHGEILNGFEYGSRSSKKQQQKS